MDLRLGHRVSARSALRALREQTLCQLTLPQALHPAEDHEQQKHHATGGRERDGGFQARSRPGRAAHGHSVACQDSLYRTVCPPLPRPSGWHRFCQTLHMRLRLYHNERGEHNAKRT
jgi:hypothetical protein